MEEGNSALVKTVKSLKKAWETVGCCVFTNTVVKRWATKKRNGKNAKVGRMGGTESHMGGIKNKKKKKREAARGILLTGLWNILLRERKGVGGGKEAKGKLQRRRPVVGNMMGRGHRMASEGK